MVAGDTLYQYDLDGFLVNKAEGADITQYDYSSRGEFLSVALPDGGLIEEMLIGKMAISGRKLDPPAGNDSMAEFAPVARQIVLSD